MVSSYLTWISTTPLDVARKVRGDDAEPALVAERDNAVGAGFDVGQGRLSGVAVVAPSLDRCPRLAKEAVGVASATRTVYMGGDLSTFSLQWL